MKKNETVDVVDIVGPKPSDGTGLIILQSLKKHFFVPCSGAQAEICFILKNKLGQFNLLGFSNYVLNMAEATVDKAIIYRTCEQFYSHVLINTKEGKKVKFCTDDAISSINIALSCGAEIYIKEESLNEVANIEKAYISLKGHFGSCYPLQNLTWTDDLRALYEFLEDIKV